MKLYPSILTSSLATFENQIAAAIASDEIKVVQIDLIDGYFADNTTLSALDITQIDYEDLQLDFHLMVEEPIDFLHEIIAIKEHLPIRAIIAQVERMSYQEEFIEELSGQGWQVGLALDLFTPVTAIDKDSWEELDIVQLMTVETGFQGQKFNKNALRKIPSIRDQAQKEVEVIVDGGIKLSNLKSLLQEDVNAFAVGSDIWTAPDPIQAMREYSQLLD